MSKLPSLAAFDLDGTLFDRSAQLSTATIETLERLSKPGLHFVAATGRSHRSAAPRLSPTSAIRWAVCDNGAVLYDLEQAVVTESHPLPRDSTMDTLATIRASTPDLAWAWESLTQGFFWIERFASLTTLPPDKWQQIDDGSELPDDMLKLYLAHPEMGALELAAHIRDEISTDLAITTSGAEFLEATAPGVNKAWMLNRLSQQLDIDQEHTIAFGDNLNDVEMLSWAGTGYAMANAHPLAVEAADAVTALAHDADGVADVLRQVFGWPNFID